MLHLLGVPAGANTEVEAPAGDQIEARHHLGGDDGIALGHQADTGAEAERAGHRRGRSEAHEGVEGVRIFRRQHRPAPPGRAAAGGDVRVLGHEEGLEPPLLQRGRELGERDGIVGGEDDGADFHGLVLSQWCPVVGEAGR